MDLRSAYNLTTGTTNGKNWSVTTHYVNGYNSDIIQTIINQVPAAAAQTVQLAKYFKAATPKETASKIWHFLKNNVQYKADGEDQNIKLPARLLLDGSGDCKSYTLFTAAILENLKLPYTIRFTSYSANPQPSHVYVVTPSAIIDAVYNRFNAEKPFTFKKNYNMKIQSINGPGSCYENPINGVLAAIGLAPARKAFLTLIEFNVFDYARALAVYNSRNAANLKKTWEKVGGDYNSLIKSINTGKGKKRILGINGGRSSTTVPAAAATGAAAAGGGITFASVIAAASVILPFFTEIIRAGKKELPPEPTPPTPPSAGTGPTPPSPGVSTNTLLIGGGILLAFLFLNKR
jgi:hypothetical protein